ncbi:hypothetical protein [Paenibacillus koleovorans]|uniref:hypothetical protein n=1 Tax=Paenibacillus koleovorans TaxID=121608 RepID=UPI000FDABC94|nr:hypothetical protein [Paenibacillus koleovorans]
MSAWVRLLGTVLLAVCIAALGGSNAALALETGTPSQEETQALLEKGLTLYELDKEIARLSGMEKEMAGQIEGVRRSIGELDGQIEEQQGRVKQLLQASYTGDRLPTWALILSSRTWKDALYVFEQMQLVAERDRRTLDRFAEMREAKAKLNAELEAAQAKLADSRSRYEERRRQMTELQQEVARKLEALPHKDEIARQMSELNRSWESKGLPLFRQYFSGLAQTMQKLPELIAQNPNTLTIKGFTYTFRIRDSELNDFIHARNAALKPLNFTFGDTAISATGQQDGITVSLTGQYVLETKPNNVIRFRIQDITYNELKLPSSTTQALQKEYDLNFYPTKLAPFLQATELKVKDRALSVTLKMGF